MSLTVIDWQDFLNKPSGEKSAMTIGVFDGVHIGHIALIERIVKRGPNSTVITFRENPKKVIPGSYKGDIYSLKQKLAIFSSMGVQRAVLIDFSREFSKIKGQDFINLLRERGGMVFLAIGSDFRCGYRQDTDSNMLREINERNGIPTELFPPVFEPSTAKKRAVSSSRIRAAIYSGNIKLAAELLGRNFGLDLSDLTPEYRGTKGDLLSGKTGLSGYVYDPGLVHRIAPESGEYSVLMYPGGIGGLANVEKGKVSLPNKAESLEFIGV